MLATLIAGADSQSRMLFDAGRTGLLPAKLGQVHPRSGSPVNALLVMAGAGLGIIGAWWLSRLITGVPDTPPIRPASGTHRTPVPGPGDPHVAIAPG